MTLPDEVIQRIVMDPEFPLVLDYIEEHFKNSIDIQTIDVANTSTVVHAEVIARQRIDNDLTSLRASFEMQRQNINRSRRSYE